MKRTSSTVHRHDIDNETGLRDICSREGCQCSSYRHLNLDMETLIIGSAWYERVRRRYLKTFLFRRIVTLAQYPVYRVPKMAQFLHALTSPNINRFSKLFHCQNREKICNNTITKDHTTPQVCCYTLWNVSVLKATIENKTTSVTTHFLEINRKQRVCCLLLSKVGLKCHILQPQMFNVSALLLDASHSSRRRHWPMFSFFVAFKTLT